MTTQNIFEQLQLVFPQVNVNMVLKEINDAQKKFCLDTRILRSIVEINNNDGATDLSTMVEYVIPSNVLEVNEIEYYKSDKQVILMDVRHKIMNRTIKWFGTISQFNGFANNVDNIKLYCIIYPSEVTTLSTELQVPAMFTEGVQAKVFERMYSMFPIEMIVEGRQARMINTNMIQYFGKIYKDNVIQAKKYLNSIDGTKFINIFQGDKSWV